MPDWREAMAQRRLEWVALRKTEEKMKDTSSIHASLGVVLDEDRRVAMPQTDPLLHDGFFQRARRFDVTTGLELRMFRNIGGLLVA